MGIILRGYRLTTFTSIPLAALSIWLILITSCTGTSAANKSSSSPTDFNQIQSSQDPDAGIFVQGRLSFPSMTYLTFNTNGEIGNLLVKEGDRVATGTVLAELDAVTIAELNHSISKNKRDVNKAQETLAIAKQTFDNTPSEKILHEEKIAKARIASEAAEIDLDNFQRTHEKAVANAIKVEATAQVALRKARESLDDFERNHEKSLAAAYKVKADSELALEKADLALKNFDRDEKQLLDTARDIESAEYLKLETAQDSLSDFIIDYEQELATAQKTVGTEEEDLETAVDAVSDFLHNPQDRDLKDGTNWDLEALARLRIKVELAKADLDQAKTDLDRIKNGPNSLKKSDLETAVILAETKLQKAKDDVADLSDGLDTIKLAQRKAAVKISQNKLEQSIIDLSEKEKGWNPFDRLQLQSAIQVAESALSDATADLSRKLSGPDLETLELKKITLDKQQQVLIDLTDVPDRYEVAVQQTNVTLALAELENSLKDLEGATIIAPSDGIISIINGSETDSVDKESNIFQLIDPSEAEIIATIDASKLGAIDIGNTVKISLASLPGNTLNGVVTFLSENPDTERGIVGYELRISITVPQSLEIPLDLSSASATVYP